jgi:hypothetical protein
MVNFAPDFCENADIGQRRDAHSGHGFEQNLLPLAVGIACEDADAGVLLPGFASEAMNPESTRSARIARVFVACCAALTFGSPAAMMTSTLALTSSAACAAS